MTHAQIIKALGENARATLALEIKRTELPTEQKVQRAGLTEEINRKYSQRDRLRRELRKIKPYMH